VVNTAILGALVRATELVDIANIEKVIRERFSDSLVDNNLTAVRKTYEITRLQKKG
jgi:Pyruvate/2-oxoacid:ferredoxin oxidoreductase gamma subunit